MSRIAILTFLVLTAAVGYAFIYPSVGDLTALAEEKQSYDNSLQTISNIESQKSELLRKYNEISDEDKKEIDTILPNSLNLIKLISDIDAVAARNGVSISGISSAETSSSVGDSIEGAGQARPYQSAVIGFSFEASYEKFNSFMGDLENSLRILDVKSINLTAGDKGVYSYDVQFETYWLE